MLQRLPNTTASSAPRPERPLPARRCSQLARCAQARGDAQRARTLLTRAAQIPQVARRATDMLVQTPESGATKAKGDTGAEAMDVPLS